MEVLGSPRIDIAMNHKWDDGEYQWIEGHYRALGWCVTNVSDRWIEEQGGIRFARVVTLRRAA